MYVPERGENQILHSCALLEGVLLMWLRGVRLDLELFNAEERRLASNEIFSAWEWNEQYS